MQRLLSIAVAGSYLLTNPLTQVMYKHFYVLFLEVVDNFEKIETKNNSESGTST